MHTQRNTHFLDSYAFGRRNRSLDLHHIEITDKISTPRILYPSRGHGKESSYAGLILLLLLISYFFALPCQAQQSIKERMRARIPAINALFNQGVVGENNKGFLEFRKNSPAHKGLVDAENQDRLKVYTAIAKQQGANPELVGNRRAKQIVEKSKPGTWLQNDAGSWYQK